MKKLITAICGVMIFLIANSSGATPMPGYVGSKKCFNCHEQQFNDWQASGHPYKIRKMEKARYSKLPLPRGWRWEDISYVIGGVNKKARYIDKYGYIIITAKDGSEAKTQYNINDGSWSFYHKGEKHPYKCGPCHMTAYSKKGHEAGLPGMIGTWAEDGIGCEECHGPGARHVADNKVKMKVDSSAKGCGKCHHRSKIDGPPPARGGFIRHHEQYNELVTGVHKDLSCTECHDPHKRAILAKDNCASCHEDQGASFARNIHAKSGITCKDCHMPMASKSAIKTGKFRGDVRTHLFKINTNPKAKMFVAVKGKKDDKTNGFVTLDFACLSCHGSRDMKWAARMAKKIHQ